MADVITHYDTIRVMVYWLGNEVRNTRGYYHLAGAFHVGYKGFDYTPRCIPIIPERTNGLYYIQGYGRKDRKVFMVDIDKLSLRLEGTDV